MCLSEEAQLVLSRWRVVFQYQQILIGENSDENAVTSGTPPFLAVDSLKSLSYSAV